VKAIHQTMKKLTVQKECSDSDDNLHEDENNGVIIEIENKRKKHTVYHDTPKDTRVKYFLIDFDSMSYLSKMRYIQGVDDEQIVMTEQLLADYMVKINDKFFDYYDQAPIIRNLLDL
jgi:hypothetical protein